VDRKLRGARKGERKARQDHTGKGGLLRKRKGGLRTLSSFSELSVKGGRRCPVKGTGQTPFSKPPVQKNEKEPLRKDAAKGEMVRDLKKY